MLETKVKAAEKNYWDKAVSVMVGSAPNFISLPIYLLSLKHFLYQVDNDAWSHISSAMLEYFGKSTQKKIEAATIIQKFFRKRFVKRVFWWKVFQNIDQIEQKRLAAKAENRRKIIVEHASIVASTNRRKTSASLHSPNEPDELMGNTRRQSFSVQESSLVHRPVILDEQEECTFRPNLESRGALSLNVSTVGRSGPLNCKPDAMAQVQSQNETQHDLLKSSIIYENSKSDSDNTSIPVKSDSKLAVQQLSFRGYSTPLRPDSPTKILTMTGSGMPLSKHLLAVHKSASVSIIETEAHRRNLVTESNEVENQRPSTVPTIHEFNGSFITGKTSSSSSSPPTSSSESSSKIETKNIKVSLPENYNFGQYHIRQELELGQELQNETAATKRVNSDCENNRNEKVHLRRQQLTHKADQNYNRFY